MFILGAKSTQNTTISEILLESDCKSKPSAYFDVLFRMHLIGDSLAGKTELMRCIAGQPFTRNPFFGGDGLQIKIREDVKNTIIKVADATVMLNLWHNRGHQELKHSSEKAIGAHAILLVCDLTNLDSFKSIEEHHRVVRSLVGDNTRVYIVGTKHDAEICTVSEQQLISFAIDHKCNGVAFVSSEKKQGVNEFFSAAAKDLLLHSGMAKIITSGETSESTSSNKP